MKVVQVVQSAQLRGAEVFACLLSNHLCKLGHEVIVVCLFRGNATLPFAGRIIMLDRPKAWRLIDWAGWLVLGKEIKRFGADLVQANSGDTLKYAILSKVFTRWGSPVVFRNASMISRYINSKLVKKWNQYLLSRVSLVLSVSESSRKDITAMYPFLTPRARTIPIGIELLNGTLSQTRDEYIIHVGGFTYEKNHTGLLRIFERLTQSISHLDLWLVGDGPLRKGIEMEALERGLNGRVKFLGNRSNLRDLLHNARALVLPSIIEGLPSVILEAMSCRTPVVAYDVGGVSEVLESRVTGWLVPQGDEEGFLNAVLELLQSNAGNMVERAHCLVAERYDIRRIALKFEKAYESIIGETRNGPRTQHMPLGSQHDKVVRA